MTVAGRIKEGDLLLAGDVNERLPVVQNGLIAHYPLDGTDMASYIGNYHNTETVINTVGKTYYKLELLSAYGANWHGIKEIEGYINSIKQSLTGLKVSSETYVATSDYVNGKTITEGNYGGLNAFDGVLDANATSSQWLTPKDSTGVDNENYATYDPFIKPEWITWSSNNPLEEVWIYNGRYGDSVSDTTQYKDFNLYISSDNSEWTKIVSGRLNQGGWLNGSQNKIIISQKPSVNTNTILTDECISIEKSTTNLWTGGFTPYNNFGVPASITPLNETYMGQPVYRLAMTIDSAHSANLSHFQTTLDSHGVYGGSLSWVQDTKYASSIYWRPVNKPDTVFGGTASNTGGWSAGPTEYLEDGWRRYYRYRTGTGVATKSDVVHHSFYCPSLQLNETIYIDVCCPQTEQGNLFPMSYMSGSRTNGTFHYKLNGMSSKTSFTIHFEYKHPDLSSNSSNMVFMSSYDGVTGGSWFGLTASTNTLTTFGIASPTNVWNKATLSYDGTTTKFYLNGVYKASTSGKTMFGTDYLSFSSMFGWGSATYLASHKIRNVSIYDRTLTDAEINKLANQSFQITKEGNLIADKIIEKPNGIPNNGIYIPLDFNGKNRLGLVSPSTELNTSYEDGTVWIGNSTTNLLYDSGVFNGSFGGLTLTPTVTTIIPNNRYKIVTDAGTGSTIRFYIPLSKLTNGLTYNLSYKYKIIRGTTFNMGDWCDTTLTKKDIKHVGYTFSSAYGTKATYDSTYRFMDFNVSPDTEVEIWDIQLEEKTFPTPFVNGTRNATRLEYSPSILNVSAGAIIGWWNFNEEARKWRGPGNNNDYAMLFSTYEGAELNKLNIRSYYSNAANTWNVSLTNANIGFTVSDGWHMIALCWDQVNSKAKLLVDGKLIQELTGVALPTAYNNPLRLGQWDTGVWGSMNQYMKDFMILSRYPSDSEIASMYQTQMRAYPDRIQIQGSIRDNQTL